MRVRAWWRQIPQDSNAIDVEGPPWIEPTENEVEGPFVMCKITGAEPGGERVLVKILESEWPILKARIDAAFAGEDPNRSEFYSGDPKITSRS